MDELTLIKVTQYAYAILNKTLPRGYVLKGSSVGSDIVEFHKFEQNQLFEYYGRPVGFYFKNDHRFELRSKYDGYELLTLKGDELDKVIEEVK